LTVLKPYFIIIYPLVTFGIFIKNWRTQEKDFSRFWRFFYQIVTLGLPLFILILPWMVRNEIVLGKFIPAQENTWAGYNYSSSRLAFANFAGAWGGGSIYWDENDAGCYFLTQFKGVCNFTIPEYALTEGYDRAEIERVRQDFIRLQENYSPDLDVRTTAEFKRLSKIYREEQPFRYYIGSKFIFLKKLFWHTNNYNLPIHSSFRCFSSYQLFFKVVQFGIYLLALTLGSFGLIKIIVQRRSSALFVFIVLITIVLFLELRTSEVRYVSLLLPIFIIGLADTVSSWKYLQNRLT
jgi:hypothetical protein